MSDANVVLPEGMQSCRICGETWVPDRFGDGHTDEACFSNLREMVESGDMVMKPSTQMPSAAPVGSAACPVCGVDTPHAHDPLEIKQYASNQIARWGFKVASIRAIAYEAKDSTIRNAIEDVKRDAESWRRAYGWNKEEAEDMLAMLERADRKLTSMALENVTLAAKLKMAETAARSSSADRADCPNIAAILHQTDSMTLVDALSYIATWENERAVAQALRGSRDPHTGALWDTCFRHAFKALFERRAVRG